MAEQKYDGGGNVVEEVTKYVQRCGAPLFGIDEDPTQLQAMTTFLTEEGIKEKIRKLCTGDIPSITLEMKTPSKSRGDDESGDKDMNSQPVSKDSIEFAVSEEIPSTAFEGGQSSDYDRNYLLFTNISESGAIQDTDDVSMSSQVLISTFDPQQPLQSMIPYIRHMFMPIAEMRAKGGVESSKQGQTKASAIKAIVDKLRELELKIIESQDEDKLQDVVLRPIPEISQWLDTLQESQREAIIEGHKKNRYDMAIPDHLKDTKVINKLLRKLKDWKDEATKVTKRKKAGGGRVNTVQQEMKFWKGKMAALDQVEDQLETVGVCATLLVLYQNNKLVQARGFVGGVQVNKAREEVQLQNEVLSTFPIASLRQSGNVKEIIAGITEIFQHLDAFKDMKKLPVDRILELAQAAARDVSMRLKEVLGTDIMAMKYSTFVEKTKNTERLFDNFQSGYQKLQTALRQRALLANTSYGRTGHMLRDQETDLKVLQKRVESIKRIRKGHAEIAKVVESTFGAGSTDKETMEDELTKIADAYKVFRGLDVLNVDDKQWEHVVHDYESKIQEVEDEIQGMIQRAMEGTQHDPRQMFRVCEKYSKLFVREGIRKAVWNFHDKLIKNVQKEVTLLKARYDKRYPNIPAARLSNLRDIPPVSGEVIWCRQLKRQLDQNEQRLVSVLGTDWKTKSDSSELADDIKAFGEVLDTNKLVKQWEQDKKSLVNFDDQAAIFKIEKHRQSLSLQVAFDEDYVKMFKEVRCLLSLGIRIDITLRLQCIDVKQKYPIAVKLKEAVNIFTRTCLEIEEYSRHSVIPRDEMDDDLEDDEDLKDEDDDEDGTAIPDANKTMSSQLTTLVEDYKFKCQNELMDGAKKRWQQHEKMLNKYVGKLSKATIELQDKTQKARELCFECDKILAELQSCELIESNVTERIEKLQYIVNKLDDGGFYGVPYWTSILNTKLERIFKSRVDEILDGWMESLDEDWDDRQQRVIQAHMEMEDATHNIFARHSPIIHVIKEHNNVVKIEPCISEAKLALGRDIQALLAMLVNQPRPRSDHGTLEEDDEEEETSFKSLLPFLNTAKIVEGYRKIDRLVSLANDYSQTWLYYQALYNMDLNAVFEELGDDIGKWRKLLIDMKASASSFDMTETEKCFGPIVIQYGSVRNKVDEKYRKFRQDTFKALKHRLGNLLRDFHKKANNGKKQLEETAFDMSSTKAIVTTITQLMTLKEESEDWMSLYKECKLAEELLQSNRYNLGATWMFSSRILGVLKDFFSVLDKRWGDLKKEATSIYAALEKQNDSIAASINRLEERWHAEKPTEGWASTWTDEEVVAWMKNYENGALRPCIEGFRAKETDGRILFLLFNMDDQSRERYLKTKLDVADTANHDIIKQALHTLMFTNDDVHRRLEEFEQKVESIEGQFKEVGHAKDAIAAIVDGNATGGDPNDVAGMLDSMKQEMAALNEVHEALTQRWNKLKQIGQENFMRCDTRELSKALRLMEEDCAKLPSKLKQYQVFDKFMSIIGNKKKMAKQILGDLNAGGIESPILKEKHWREIFKLLHIKRARSSVLTIEDLWSINLLKFINEIRAICSVAQGENSLEKFLEELQEKWSETKFELAQFQGGKVPLVTNWNDLMESVADSLTDVMAMKQSPYFKAFEQAATQWEDKLNQATAIFDIMVDVQRRWVYLQGVFTNSESVKRQLGGFYQKFKAFDKEFIQLMKRIKAETVVDRWVSPEEALLQKLEMWQSTLNQIQKALNEYLESERAKFARFYFIGDDDLLDIIGNSKDIKSMNRHLAKMFAGIVQFRTAPDNDSMIVAMQSKEGETVSFVKPVDVKAAKTVQDWLLDAENQMRVSLATLLEDALETQPAPEKRAEYFQWCGRYPAQVALLATQIKWSEAVDANLKRLSSDQSDEAHEQMVILLEELKKTLKILADQVLQDVPASIRKLYEQLITELVYQRDETKNIIKARLCQNEDFKWLYRMRFYWNKSEKDVLKKLQICISRAKFYYGFEYFGASEKLVQTPLTDKAYMTLCEALHAKQGGFPFGPAGTGKTESVKALGAQLGRFVLVFCCDEAFDYAAMSRIFIGLCQCGAWGCFDEFNRLEEKILSAVSQQILTIQTGLKNELATIPIRDQPVKLNPNVGIFVTMNPGYAGRSDLPDNLKQLFRGMAMMKPNRVLIAEVMLFSQGFIAAPILSSKIVLLFELCKDQLSDQAHYDFGLRALKSVLRSAGNVKRSEMNIKRAALHKGDDDEAKVDDMEIPDMTPKEEETILIRSLLSTVVPKLVMNDKFLFDSLMDSAFPGAEIQGFKEEQLKAAIAKVAEKKHLRMDEGWLIKLMQLYTIQNINHGVMLVGPSGGGKSAARNTLLEAMEMVDGIKSEQYEIDPKAISKDELYGTLDATTLEWTDGVFTATLRMIIDNVRGESNKRHWIVFDGDVDPIWAENLNSVLDDNKMLTLPNGERLSLTPNIRIMFETPTLFYATPATVSRCGMVWFSQECVTTNMCFDNKIMVLRNDVIEQAPGRPFKDFEKVANICCDFIKPYFLDDMGLAMRCLEWAETRKHVMAFTRMKAINTLFSLLKGGILNILEYNESEEYPLNEDQVRKYYGKYLLFCLLWGYGGPMQLELRYEFGRNILKFAQGTDIDTPDDSQYFIDYEVNIEVQDWTLWNERINNPELQPENLKNPNIVISTIDTLRHEAVIRSWLADKKLCILCGPPGSGKSMTLMAVLNANPQFELVTLNFSATAGTELVFKAFDQFCRIERRAQDYYLTPTFGGNKTMVLFCDECNLPAEDAFGTQTIVTFIRQLVDKQGYWHPIHKYWVNLDNIQFVAACNPPTDSGRVILKPRFLNLCPLILVDYPGRESLVEIYGVFIKAMMKMTGTLKDFGGILTEAMVDVYLASNKRFNADIQPHYVYSPRELSRWQRGMTKAFYNMKDELGGLTAEEMIRLWAHEALRLFSDRLVDIEERKWTRDCVWDVARDRFGQYNLEVALEEPILFSDYLGNSYTSVQKNDMRNYVLERLKVFNEEELDVQLVIYDELLDHILRIDRVLRQPLGHLLMCGASGAGKTVFSRFVSWMQGMGTFQIKVHKDYTPEDFDTDLRGVLVESGVNQKKMTFIFDESNILDTAFLERMNALLASGEVPGLFEDAEYMQLMMKLREAARADGLLLDTEEELFNMFTRNVRNNLHIVFTMNPAGGDMSGRAATSPALFNRCVVNWWGTWPDDALLQVAAEFTEELDLEIGVPEEFRSKVVEPEAAITDEPEEKKDEESPEAESAVKVHKELAGVHLSVAETIVKFHKMIEKVMEYLANNMVRSTFVTPRHYLDLIHHFVALFDEKREQLQKEQKRLATGLKALRDTEEEVAKKQVELDVQSKDLAEEQERAKETVNKMMEAEKEATKKKEEAIKTNAEVEVEKEKISARTAEVATELADAKPALEAAQKAVSNINKKQLNEIKALKKPPAAVEKTMNAVCLLMSKKTKNGWKDVQKILANKDFIPDILKFDTNKVDSKVREKVNKKYIKDDTWSFESVNKASKVAGPLVLWVKSQVKFAHLLDQVEPMTREIQELKKSMDAKVKQGEELTALVVQLEENIVRYKEEYAVMMAKITQLQNDMQTVQLLMGRATKLLGDLSEEKERWSGQTESFKKQISTLDGDCLLSAGFLTYSGFYSQTYREIIVKKWKEILKENNLPYNENIDLLTYLSTAEERKMWQENKLPDDILCQENAIILSRFNRFPLLVDPSGQATTFVMANNKKLKIVKTSFLDSAFNKNLESALRFGNALLIEDVEMMDPILNPVLNREWINVGGRKVVRLASKEIDWAPDFTMFLVTKDPLSSFAPDLCSRVTFVNFSVTPSSLKSQCLNKVLRVERPDVEARRHEQLTLQTQFKYKLQALENDLLTALNSVTGNILDDTELMGKLETIKTESKKIAEKAGEAEKVLMEVEEATQFYVPFGLACSKLYFSLENLANVHFLYQFDLKYFFQITEYVLSNGVKNNLPEIQALDDQKDPEGRLVPLIQAMHRVTYLRTRRALRVNDHISWGLRIAQCFLEVHPDDQMKINPEYLLYILKGKGHAHPEPIDADLARDLELTTIGTTLLGGLFPLPGFEKLKGEVDSNRDDWRAYKGGPAEASIPDDWATGTAENDFQNFLEMMVIQKPFRPDQMIRSGNKFIESVFGWSLAEFDANAETLREIIEDQCDETIPILLASTPGNDPSEQVDGVAREVFGLAQMDKKYQAFSLGAPKDYERADNAITQATKRGTWVCLKNVHLSPDWLQTMEKRLNRLKKDPNFRLFMTMEIHPKVPVTLLRKSSIIVFEPPLGIKASLQRTFNGVDGSRVDRAPMERSRLYILLAWLHATILERLRFCPIGWSKAFEFSETDLFCAMEAMDEWIDKVTNNRSNIDPNEITWDALHKMLVQYVYGGRIDNKYDTARLEGFVEYLFSPEAFNENFSLASFCVSPEDGRIENAVGRLGYVCPTVDGEKMEKEMLARIVQEDGSKVKIVFKQKYMVFGKMRVNLNSTENWINESEFREMPQQLLPIVLCPKKTTYQDLRKWVLEVDEDVVNNPAIVGLPPRAELMILANRAKEMCDNLLTLQEVETGNAMDELTAILDAAASGDGDEEAGAVPLWMRELRDRSKGWLDDVPDTMERLVEQADSMKNPLFRFMRREFQCGVKVLGLVNEGLNDLCAFVDGEIKATNILRSLVAELSHEHIPKRWNLYTIDDLTIDLWILDFVRRVEMMNAIAQEDYVTTPQSCKWLGGFFQPAGFIAATRQYVSNQNGWPLESLRLCIEIGEDEWKPNSFIFEGITLYGAGFDDKLKCLVLTEKTSTPLPKSRLIWRNDDIDGVSKSKEWKGKAPDKYNLQIPVYLNATFKHLLFDIYVPVYSALPSTAWVHRAVSLSVWSN